MLSWLLESSAIAAVLALIAALAGRFTRLGPATRHLLWVLVLIRLMMPPLFHWPVDQIWPERSAGTVDAMPHVLDEPAAPIEVDEANLSNLEIAEREVVETETTASLAISSKPIESSRFDVTFWLLTCWVAGSIAWVGTLCVQVGRFRRGIAISDEAPEEIRIILEDLGRSMGVRIPRTRVVADLESPMLWCLGRPTLLLPESLIESLGVEAWQGILAHELAHIHRGDPWFGRLLMASGAFFWWHPLYQIARRRIEAEAELACDAWVVGVLPKGRRRYAEALVDVCEVVSLGRVPAPALGVGSRPGRFLERRLIMILQEHVSPRTSPVGLLALGLLAAFSTPSWTRAQDEPVTKVVVTAGDEPKVGTDGKSLIIIPHPVVTVTSDDPQPKPDPATKPEPGKKVEKGYILRKEVTVNDFTPKLEFKVETFNDDTLKAMPESLRSALKGLSGVDGDEITAKVKEALDKANLDEPTRQAIEGQLKAVRAAVVQAHGRSPLSDAEMQVKRAKAQLAAAEARLKAETAKLSEQKEKLEKLSKTIVSKEPAAARPARTTTNRGVGVVRGERLNVEIGSDIEKRMEKLESKVDALLDELKAIRNQSKPKE